MSAKLHRVAIVATGGTVAWRTESRLQHADYASTGRPAPISEVIAELPELHERADIVAIDAMAAASSELTTADLLDLLRRLEQLEHDGVDAVVITHGTATMEETAYFLRLTFRSKLPVVVVGAQRPFGVVGSDALTNLYHAVLVATSEVAASLGVVVVFDAEVHSPRDVRKAHTTALSAFRSPLGPVGSVGPDGRVVVRRAPLGRYGPASAIDLSGVNALPRVDIATSYLGSDGTAVHAFVDAGAAAIVSAGLAPGLVPDREFAALADAVARGVVVVQSSRAGAGAVVPASRWTEVGIIDARDLDPPKARVLTMAGLAAGLSTEALGACFDDH